MTLGTRLASLNAPIFKICQLSVERSALNRAIFGTAGKRFLRRIRLPDDPTRSRIEPEINEYKGEGLRGRVPIDQKPQNRRGPRSEGT
jgi:hypothetical protein